MDWFRSICGLAALSLQVKVVVLEQLISKLSMTRLTSHVFPVLGFVDWHRLCKHVVCLNEYFHFYYLCWLLQYPKAKGWPKTPARLCFPNGFYGSSQAVVRPGWGSVHQVLSVGFIMFLPLISGEAATAELPCVPCGRWSGLRVAKHMGWGSRFAATQAGAGVSPPDTALWPRQTWQGLCKTFVTGARVFAYTMLASEVSPGQLSLKCSQLFLWNFSRLTCS